ncbi:MAG: hypothetical protein V4670_12170 [Bacteroidota bacterium]
MSIVKTDLVTAFGAYYLQEGQNMDRLKSAIRQPAVTPSYAKPIISESDLYRTSNTVLGEIVQSFQKAFTAKGDITFTPNEIRLRNAKIDLSLYPDDVKASWLGFLGSLTIQERAEWPIVRFLLENEIAPQIAHDLETKAYWGGSYVAPTPGTAGTAAGTMDGLKKLIDAGLTATTMNAIALTALPTPTSMFDAIEEFTDDMLADNEALEGAKIRVFMEPKFLRNYFRDKRNTHGNDVNYVAGVNTVDFTPNIELVALPSMAGSGYIFATPADNFLHCRKVNGMQDPKVEESKREVSLLLDWYEGIGFAYNELVYAFKPA